MGLVPRHLSPACPQVPDSQRAGRWQHSRRVCGSGSGPGGVLITGVGTCPGAARGPPQAGLARAAPGLLCSFLHRCPVPFPLGDFELDVLHSFIALLPFFVFHLFFPPGAQKPHLLLWWPGCGHRGQACPCRLGPRGLLHHQLEAASSQGDHLPSPACRLLVLQFACWPDCEFVGGECILVHSFCMSESLRRLQNSSYTEGHPGLPPAACLALPEQSG